MPNPAVSERNGEDTWEVSLSVPTNDHSSNYNSLRITGLMDIIVQHIECSHFVFFYGSIEV